MLKENDISFPNLLFCTSYFNIAKIAEKKALDEQVLKNRPELATFESVLAMRIVGVKGAVDLTLKVIRSSGQDDWEWTTNIFFLLPVCSFRYGPATEDHIGFVFTRISEQDWEKEFTMTVDVSHHDFQGITRSPVRLWNCKVKRTRVIDIILFIFQLTLDS